MNSHQTIQYYFADFNWLVNVRIKQNKPKIWFPSHWLQYATTTTTKTNISLRTITNWRAEEIDNKDTWTTDEWNMWDILFFQSLNSYPIFLDLTNDQSIIDLCSFLSKCFDQYINLWHWTTHLIFCILYYLLFSVFAIFK